jgi:disulfide bond formation protein DsbB
MAGGVGGFKLVGALMGALVQSRAFGYTMGAYGAGMSVYRNFMARGHEVVFPKNTAMEISLGTRAAASPPPATTAQPVPSSGAGQ